MSEEDLRPWGYAPGWYMFKCRDCPDPKNFMDWAMGAKRSWRCEHHARAAMGKEAANRAENSPQGGIEGI